jgi:hypothetical protein
MQVAPQLDEESDIRIAEQATECREEDRHYQKNWLLVTSDWLLGQVIGNWSWLLVIRTPRDAHLALRGAPGVFNCE